MSFILKNAKYLYFKKNMNNKERQSPFFETKTHTNKQSIMKKYQDTDYTQQISQNIAHSVGYSLNGKNVFCPAYPY